jgi:2-oxoglutarate dehydrogenase E2 component (dihydrolipoamide succinyltransferase)
MGEAATLIDLITPLEQEGTKSVVRNWLKKPGDAVVEHEPVVELETDKVAVEVAAPASGVLTEILLGEGADAPPGALLGRIGPSGAPAAKAAPKAEPRPAAAEPAAPTAAWSSPGRSIASFDPELRLSPSVRRLLIEHGVDPEPLLAGGTGRGGRLTRADVVAAIEGGGAQRAAKPAPQPAARPGGSTLVPHDAMRRRIAEHMVHSVAVAPHVTAVFEADFSAIAAHRQALKARGVNLTYTAYIVAAAAEAMKVSPTVNSRWHEDHLEVFADANIGVGTALGDKGLIVPVVQRANALTLEEIGARLADLTERARSNRLKPADVQGGTFSISNHGVSGSLVATPIIINQPQSAILGVGKLEKRVVVREIGGQDAILVRPMAYVSLTIDHRVLDGVQTNAWLTRFVEVIEGWPAA